MTNTSKIDPRFNFDQMLLNAQRLNDKKKEKTYTIIHNENLSNINETFLNDIVIYNDVEFNKACNYSQNENFHKNSAILKYNNITGDLILCLFNINDTFDMKKNSSFNETNENFFNLKNDTFNTEKKVFINETNKDFSNIKNDTFDMMRKNLYSNETNDDFFIYTDNKNSMSSDENI
ncbi:hypothetical protein GVAV_001052 [Gurleya vavrai]